MGKDSLENQIDKTIVLVKKLERELAEANKKIEELEKENKRLRVINEYLTE